MPVPVAHHPVALQPAQAVSPAGHPPAGYEVALILVERAVEEYPLPPEVLKMPEDVWLQ